jgi:multicomponent Na+:H+ antiporter subunit E
MSRRNTILWGLLLFAFWVLLSGKLDRPHLAMGVVCAAGVTALTRPLLALPPSIGPGVDARLDVGLLVRGTGFLAWLIGQIVVGSLQVARVVLHPRLPVDPQMVRLRPRLPHPLARLTLANSITLTPGTVTLDVDGAEILVHALTPESARGLGNGNEEGDMPRRVGLVFEPVGSAR